MTDDEKFLLVSLEESKAKKLAEVMSNDTCRKILDFLATNEGTESEISKALKIPLSTVHYNIKHLVEANLAVSDEFHYSEKGKEVQHYRLANKYIVIAPKNQSNVLERLKSLLPAALIVFSLGAILELLYFFNGLSFSRQEFLRAPTYEGQGLAQDTVLRSLEVQTDSALPVASKKIMDDGLSAGGQAIAADHASQTAALPIQNTINESVQSHLNDSIRQQMVHDRSIEQTAFFSKYAGIWLIIGAALILLTIIIWELAHRKKKS